MEKAAAATKKWLLKQEQQKYIVEFKISLGT